MPANGRSDLIRCLRLTEERRPFLSASVASNCLMIRLLTLILLTWKIWCVPNNARKWQMGFNSAFKGLIDTKRYDVTQYCSCGLDGLRKSDKWKRGRYSPSVNREADFGLMKYRRGTATFTRTFPVATLLKTYHCFYCYSDRIINHSAL